MTPPADRGVAKLLKIEINIIEDGSNPKWQWLGKLTPKSLKALCIMADQLSDIDMEDGNG